MGFLDRADAGRRLARQLAHHRGHGVVVVGLPRGGVPVALEVARSLHAPLDVIVVRKLGVPFQPELAMGAIGEDGVRVLNDEVLRATGVSDTALAEVERRERAELVRRAHRFRSGRARVPLAGRTVIVVDDGIATGSTAAAACAVARAEGAARVVLAVPVAPPGWTDRLKGAADELVCAETPRDFIAIGQFYEDFSPTSDEEVVACLRAGAGQEREVTVPTGRSRLEGNLTVPDGALGVIVFAHGSGSSRHSPRNRAVAGMLQRAGLGTLLFDLLTAEEERDRANVFDIGLLADRLTAVTRWLQESPDGADLPTGYFGASTGAAAALWAASEPGARVAAVVSRGGRPDLAGPRLAMVRAPTLLLVGSRDPTVLELNRQAEALLRCRHRLTVVPGASHLFEEPGTLETVARLAGEWFLAHLPASTPVTTPSQGGRA